jgi:CheY-like chemotaxis protein
MLKTDLETEEKSLEILLVDDDNSILRSSLRALGVILSGRKYVIDTASNGIEALEKVKAKAERGYGLIITDNQMPGMNGIDFYKALRSINPEQQKKVIITTGCIEKLMPALDNSLSKEDYKPVPVLKKPASMEEIRKVIEPYLS